MRPSHYSDGFELSAIALFRGVRLIRALSTIADRRSQTQTLTDHRRPTIADWAIIVMGTDMRRAATQQQQTQPGVRRRQGPAAAVGPLEIRAILDLHQRMPRQVGELTELTN